MPSGNFGNICAGHIARRMGLPIRHLILATNENNVLDEFFRTGIYQPRPSERVYKTSSPSMDISKASNFERFIFDLVGRDPERVKELWSRIARDGVFDLSETPEFRNIDRFGFLSGTSSHADRMATIRDIHAKYGKIIDTHTADGVKVGLEQREDNIPLVCLETALPVKFADSSRGALGKQPDRPSGYEDIEELPQHFKIVDADSKVVKDYITARV